LEELMLASPVYLGVGFDPPRCGNAYMGPGGDELRKRVHEQRERADELVSRSVFQACASLKKLWIDDHRRAEVSRDDQGIITDIVWYNEYRRAPRNV
jgi:hypothetical protein